MKMYIISITALCLFIVIAILPPAAKAASPDDTTNITWYDAAQLTIAGKGWNDTPSVYDRLPLKADSMVTEDVRGLSRYSAGISVLFSTDAESLLVRWALTSSHLAMPHMPATGVSGVDLYTRNQANQLSFVANGRPTAQNNKICFHLPEESGEYVLYLPLYNGVKKLKMGIPEGAKLSALPMRPEQKTIVFYGTSITQGGCASRPGLAWPTIVSRMLDVNGINLGFSGSGLMEPELAQLLNEIDADVYVLDCLWNMTPEMVRERVEPFVKILRSVHPDTPILLAEDSHLRDMPGIKGELLSVVYARLVSAGDKNLYYLANTGMLSADGEGTVDGCHPNDLGMMRHAEVFSAALRRILAKK